MSRSIAGELGLNGLFVLTGLCLLWAIRGWRSWLDVLEHLGVALMLGLGTVCVLATLVLIAGAGLSLWTILALCAAVAVPAAALAVRRRQQLPHGVGALPRLVSAETLVALGLALLTVALLVAFYRAARVSSYITNDAFAFWIPKAKAIYFFGGLDEHLFRTLPGPSYPLLVPTLQAMDFRFMGSADVPDLAFQSWLLLVGFVWSTAALLRPLVRPWLLWLFVALMTVIPNLDRRLFLAEADWTVDIFFVLTALFLVRWLRTREGWLLFGYGAMLAATFAAKREGALFVACLLVGALLATVRSRRRWLPILGVTAAAYATSIPWRIWWSSRHLQPDLAGNSVGNLHQHLSRVWPSFVVVFRLLFTYDFWLLLVPIALAAAAVGLTLRGAAREVAVFYVATWVLGVTALMWILWSDPGLKLDTHNSSTPIPRAVGSLVLLSAALAPLLIDPLLGRHGSLGSPEAGSFRTGSRRFRRRTRDDA